MQQLKPLPEWDEDYVTSLSGEFDWIEFKSSAKFAVANWHEDISKYVSAWANYDGGYLIFGIEDPQSGHPLSIDGGIPETIKPRLPDWIDQIVPGFVEPTLPKFNSRLIHPKQEGSQIKPGHLLIVLHIPESEAAPHQANDHKYYQRLGRRLSPLKHRAVMDIVGRKRHPDIKTEIIINKGNLRTNLFWRITNVGSVIALHWKVVIHFPTALTRSLAFKDEETILKYDDKGRSFLELQIGQMLRPPLFPGSDISAIYEIHPTNYSPPLSPSVEEITVITFADEMPAKREVFRPADVTRTHRKTLP